MIESRMSWCHRLHLFWRLHRRGVSAYPGCGEKGGKGEEKENRSLVAVPLLASENLAKAARSGRAGFMYAAVHCIGTVPTCIHFLDIGKVPAFCSAE